MSAKDPLPGFLAYGAAKGGLNTFGLALGREGAPHNIRVHTIAPGAVETAMFRSLVDEKTWPKDRTLDPADVARVIAACVDGTLKHTSGEVIYLNR
jgi:3-oxoacyl-[acyl-carrier protein] reductase